MSRRLKLHTAALQLLNALADAGLTAPRQPVLMAKVRRMLDIWQVVRYPAYRPGTPLEKSERAFFGFRR